MRAGVKRLAARRLADRAAACFLPRVGAPLPDTEFDVASAPAPPPAAPPQVARPTTRGPRGSRSRTPPPGVALDRVLREHYGNASWQSVRDLITRGKVLVDGQPVLDPAARVLPGTRVSVRQQRQRLERGGPLAPSALRHVDAELVVVEKPAGIASVPFSDSERGALNQLVASLLAREASGPRAPLGVVQRLDRETSGLLVFARTQRAKQHLQQQLRNRSVHRRYLALCHGHAESTTFRSRLVSDRGDGRRGSTRRADLGREAITHVRCLERLAGASLVECRLETGRTHQIRIHLAEARHPLLGERVYAPRDLELLPAPRVMLHAAELGFVHPTSGRELRFSSEIPADFSIQLQSLRAREAR